jgi:hypothetical protein
MCLTMHFGPKDVAWGDASSVDELLELLDDLIATHESFEFPHPAPDHEQRIIDEARRPSAEELADIRERLFAAADEYQDENRPWMSHLGYRGVVIYDHDAKTFRCEILDAPIAPITARSLKSLHHRFLLAVDEYLETAAGQLK